MKIAVLMDPLETLTPKKDTTLALIRAAMALGHAVWCFSPGAWFCQQEKVFADIYQITADNQPGETRKAQPLNQMQLILMRHNPPVDAAYIYASFALDLLEKQGVQVINHPSSVRDLNEKFSILQFPTLIPPTLITAQRAPLHQFWQTHQHIILKPLHGMGGEGIFYLQPQAPNFFVIVELLTGRGQRAIMAQKYIPAIQEKGDKRILMMHTEPVGYALARIPAKGDLRGNLAAGATGQAVPLTERDYEICRTVQPFLKQKRLDFVGLDVIGDYLTEMNVTSPTCLCEIEAQTGLSIAKDFWQFYQR